MPGGNAVGRKIVETTFASSRWLEAEQFAKEACPAAPHATVPSVVRVVEWRCRINGL